MVLMLLSGHTVGRSLPCLVLDLRQGLESPLSSLIRGGRDRRGIQLGFTSREVTTERLAGDLDPLYDLAGSRVFTSRCSVSGSV